ncbi:hypothetical protein HDR70_06870, partial [bacterium]|nr:hypothetical protein [bacterium]
NNYSNSSYSRLLFRRIGMGMYSFRFYDHPLSLEQQDSLNLKENLIVFNDSTVFEYGSGAFGSLDFPDKEKFLEKSKCHGIEAHHHRESKSLRAVFVVLNVTFVTSNVDYFR